MSSLIEARVLKQQNICGDTFHLILEAASPLQSSPGQFVRLSLPGILDPFLPRPFMIFEERGPVLQVVYNVRGKFTGLLSKMRQGVALELHGPLGKPFFLPEAESYLFVGGGTGAVFFYRYLPYLKRKRCLFLLGSRDSSSAWFPFFFPEENTFLITEDGSLGLKGTIPGHFPEIIKRFQPDLILTSGPLSLLKELAFLSSEQGAPLWVVLEEMMACGVGLCLSCAITVKEGEGERRACLCREGLVWQAKEVIFSEP